MTGLTPCLCISWHSLPVKWPCECPWCIGVGAFSSVNTFDIPQRSYQRSSWGSIWNSSVFGIPIPTSNATSTTQNSARDCLYHSLHWQLNNCKKIVIVPKVQSLCTLLIKGSFEKREKKQSFPSSNDFVISKHENIFLCLITSRTARKLFFTLKVFKTFQDLPRCVGLLCRGVGSL